jgi:hypothetical protein
MVLPRQHHTSKTSKSRISAETAEMTAHSKHLRYFCPMATVHTFFQVTRTMGNLTFYMMDGKNYVRKKSSLTAKRVKTSKQFARTRYHANILAQASKIGSALFQALPNTWRQSWMHRSFTGEAMQLLKQGKTAGEAKAILWNLYVKDVVTKEPVAASMPAAARRIYTKRATTYWNTKTTNALKRKQQRQALHYHASLMAKASVIASGIYRSLPPKKRDCQLYRLLTGLALTLLKTGFDEASTRLTILTACKLAKPMVRSIAPHRLKAAI